MASDNFRIQPYKLPDFSDSDNEGQGSSFEAPPESDPASDFKPLAFNSEGDAQSDFTQPETEQSDTNKKIELSENFKSNEFIQEESLLTNAEAYAKTIREGAELYSEQLKAEADNRYAEAERIKQEADEIKLAAEENARQLIQNATAQVQQIRDEGYQDGFQQGQNDGMNQRYADSEALAQQVESVLSQLKNLRNIVRFQAEQDMVQMALLIAKKVVIEEITARPEIVDEITKDLLRETDTLGKVRAFVNPDDYEFLMNSKANLEKYMDEEQALILQPSLEAEPGSIFIETDEDLVNFTFQKQFEDVEELLSRKLSERHAGMYNVDIDSYDMASLPEAPISDENGISEENYSDETISDMDQRTTEVLDDAENLDAGTEEASLPELLSDTEENILQKDDSDDPESTQQDFAVDYQEQTTQFEEPSETQINEFESGETIETSQENFADETTGEPQGDEAFYPDTEPDEPTGFETEDVLERTEAESQSTEEIVQDESFDTIEDETTFSEENNIETPSEENISFEEEIEEQIEVPPDNENVTETEEFMAES